MKFTKITIIASIVASIGISSVMAAETGGGVVTFNGSIIDAPCSIYPDSVEQTVELGQISGTTLTEGDSSVPQSFHIQLAGCSLSADSGVTVTFTGTGNADDTSLLALNGSAAGAGVAITDANDTPIVLGSASDVIALTNGDNSLEFKAFLKSDGTTVVPGSFSSVANFTMAYE
jgi:type 1 fimbria pilin